MAKLEEQHLLERTELERPAPESVGPVGWISCGVWLVFGLFRLVFEAFPVVFGGFRPENRSERVAEAAPGDHAELGRAEPSEGALGPALVDRLRVFGASKR